MDISGELQWVHLPSSFGMEKNGVFGFQRPFSMTQRH